MNYRIELPDTRPADDHEGLARLQNQLLGWAEELFGKRDTCWTPVPPIFGNRNPHTYYPDPAALKLVQVKLGRTAREKWTRVLYQMAHEVIHLLNPRRGCKANNLEEGVACAFSAYVQRRCGITGENFVRDDHDAYLYAYKLVRRLPSGSISAPKRIRKEMPAGTSFSSVTSEDLKRIFYPKVCTELADALTSTFCRDKTEFP